MSLLYDNTGQLLNNSEDVQGDAKAKSIIVRNPGQSKEYYLFNRSTSGQLLLHKVDMQTKSVAARNIALDNGTDSYGNYMSAIEDRSQGKVYLYATRYKEATHQTELVAFVIANGQVQQSKTLLTEAGGSEEGEGELQISPDGERLVWYRLGRRAGFFAQREMQPTVYKLDTDLLSASLEKALPLPQGNTYTAKASIEIASDGKGIAYSQQHFTSSATWQTDLAGTLPVKKTDYSGDIRRSIDGNLYSLQPSGYDKWNASGIVETTSIALQTGEVLTAGLPQQVHVLQAEDLAPQAAGIVARTVGKKSYELKDHLGNVRVVVSDQKEARIENGSLIEQALVTGYYNYLPFGMMEPGGSYSASTYRYGYNGKELDKEGMGGGGSTYDYGFRIYNPNIAKFLSLDPLSKKYAELTPYQFASNMPIWGVDLDGLELVIVNQSPVQSLALQKAIRENNVKETQRITNFSVHQAWEPEDLSWAKKANPV